MGIEHVLYREALAYRGGTGIKQFAEDLGARNYQVLVNKLNPNNATHHVYADELDTMVAVLDTDEVAKHFARERGLICFKAPDFAGLSDGALIDLLIGLESEKAEWLEKIKEGIADGSIDQAEFAKIRREYEDFVAAGAEVMARMEVYLQASEERAAKLRSREGK